MILWKWIFAYEHNSPNFETLGIRNMEFLMKEITTKETVCIIASEEEIWEDIWKRS